MKYKIFSLEEKKVLEKLAPSDYSLSEISKVIGRSKNGVRNEYVKGGGRKNYNAEKRHEQTLESLKKRDYSGRNREVIIPEEELNQIKDMISNGKSFWNIRKSFSLNIVTLNKIYEKLGVKNKSIYQLLEEFESRVEAIEKALDFLFSEKNK